MKRILSLLILIICATNLSSQEVFPRIETRAVEITLTRQQWTEFNIKAAKSEETKNRVLGSILIEWTNKE